MARISCTLTENQGPRGDTCSTPARCIQVLVASGTCVYAPAFGRQVDVDDPDPLFEAQEYVLPPRIRVWFMSNFSRFAQSPLVKYSSTKFRHTQFSACRVHAYMRLSTAFTMCLGQVNTPFARRSYLGHTRQVSGREDLRARVNRQSGFNRALHAQRCTHFYLKSPARVVIYAPAVVPPVRAPDGGPVAGADEEEHALKAAGSRVFTGRTSRATETLYGAKGRQGSTDSMPATVISGGRERAVHGSRTTGARVGGSWKRKSGRRMRAFVGYHAHGTGGTWRGGPRREVSGAWRGGGGRG